MNFASDNAAGIAPEILAAISQANEGVALAYGGDAWTRRVEERLADIFERELAVFLVSSGTAANALALAQLTEPWGAVLCHREAHIAADECGAPEFYGGGIKLVGLPGEAGKLAPATLQRALGAISWGGPHHVSPSVLSLSQATEGGTVYRPDEIRELAEIAHARGMSVHVDGARLGNALARLNASPAQATWMAGVDVLSFGATKGGALAAETVIFFDPDRAANMPERRTTRWPIGWQPDLPLRSSSQCGRCRPTRCSSRCPCGWISGSGPPARAIIRGRRIPCRKTLHWMAMPPSCASSPRLRPASRRWIDLWRSPVCLDATPMPKLRPIPRYRSGHTIRLPDRRSTPVIGGITP